MSVSQVCGTGARTLSSGRIMSTVKRLYRSRRERKLAGVCAGIGEYLEVDPTIVRVL